MPQLPALCGWLCIQYTIHYGNFPTIPGYSENLPEYSLILLTTYYAQNYAGITDTYLLILILIWKYKLKHFHTVVIMRTGVGSRNARATFSLLCPL